MTENKENIDHPSHYNKGSTEADGTARYEVIKIIEDLGWGFEFCMGNALKYVMRAPHKHASSSDDLLKAVWYLERAMTYTGGRVVPYMQRKLELTAINDSWDLTGALALVVGAIVAGDPRTALAFIKHYLREPAQSSSI